MNENNTNKILLLLGVGIGIGFIIALVIVGGFKDDTNSKGYEPSNEFIDLSVNIDSLKDLILLNSGCDLGDRVACDNLNKIIQNNEDYKHLWITPTGQIRYP